MTVLTDERVKLTNQAVSGARLMKINAWEPALEKEIRRQSTGLFLGTTCTQRCTTCAVRDLLGMIADSRHISSFSRLR